MRRVDRNDAGTATPHYPVALELEGDPMKAAVKVLQGPKAFPKERPMGPYPPPPSWDPCGSILDALVVTKSDLDRAYTRFCDLFEKELCGAHGIDSNNKTYLGRASGLKLKEVTAVRTSGGRLSSILLHWQGLA